MTAVTFLKRHAIAIAATILVAQSLFYYGASAKEIIPNIPSWSQFPTEVKTWTREADLPIGAATLMALQPDDYLARNYVEAGNPHTVSLFVGYFNSRRNGRAPHSPEWCLPGAGWKSVFTRVIQIPVPGYNQPFPANEYLIEKGQTQKLVLYWYHQGSRTVASDLVAQIYALPDLIFHGRTDTALVRVIVPVEGGDLAAAKAVGIGFAQSIYPLIRRHIT